jgi:c-di-GMP-binding flagellar brake protein YcgR
MEATTRLETASSNIQEIFHHLCESKTSISLLTDTNETISCIIEALDGTNKFQVKLKDKSKRQLIKPNMEYSIGCGGKDGEIYSFICKCLDEGAVLATLTLPQEITVLEQRNHERFNTLNMKNPYLELVTKSGENKIIYILNDLSQGGLSFLIPKHLEDTIKIGDKIYIKRMGKQLFKEPISGIVIHKNPLTTVSSSSIRIGVRFLDTPNN